MSVELVQIFFYDFFKVYMYIVHCSIIAYISGMMFITIWIIFLRESDNSILLFMRGLQ